MISFCSQLRLYQKLMTNPRTILFNVEKVDIFYLGEYAPADRFCYSNPYDFD
jgi:hypothetical protein